jgi:hypothetical protein
MKTHATGGLYTHSLPRHWTEINGQFHVPSNWHPVTDLLYRWYGEEKYSCPCRESNSDRPVHILAILINFKRFNKSEKNQNFNVSVITQLPMFVFPYIISKEVNVNQFLILKNIITSLNNLRVFVTYIK